MLEFLGRTATQRKILIYVFTHMEQSFHVRDIAGMISKDPGNVSRELSRLKKDGLFLSSRKGTRKIFSLNKSYPFFNELKQMITATAKRK